MGNPSPKKPLAPSEFATNNGVDGYLKMYSDVLEDTHRDVYRIIIERLRDGGEGGILFHCTGTNSSILPISAFLGLSMSEPIELILFLSEAGKDRTGILAAHILSLVKTPQKYIAYDYVLTRIGIELFREYLVGALL